MTNVPHLLIKRASRSAAVGTHARTHNYRPPLPLSSRLLLERILLGGVSVAHPSSRYRGRNRARTEIDGRARARARECPLICARGIKEIAQRGAIAPLPIRAPTTTRNPRRARHACVFRRFCVCRFLISRAVTSKKLSVNAPLIRIRRGRIKIKITRSKMSYIFFITSYSLAVHPYRYRQIPPLSIRSRSHDELTLNQERDKWHRSLFFSIRCEREKAARQCARLCATASCHRTRVQCHFFFSGREGRTV